MLEWFLSVCPVGLWKNRLPDFYEMCVARAKEEPIKYWNGSESQGGYTLYFALMGKALAEVMLF